MRIDGDSVFNFVAGTGKFLYQPMNDRIWDKQPAKKLRQNEDVSKAASHPDQ